MSMPISPKEDSFKSQKIPGELSPDHTTTSSGPLIDRRDVSHPTESKGIGTKIESNAYGQVGLPLLDIPDVTLAVTGNIQLAQWSFGTSTGVNSTSTDIATKGPFTAEGLNAMLTSTNPAIIKEALATMLTATTLNGSEQIVVDDYLEIVARALAFISIIRQRILTIESESSGQEAEAKLEIQKTMISTAMGQYDSSIKNIQKTLESTLANIDAAEKAKLWGWLGPVVTAVTSLVAVVAVIGTLGAAAPAMAVALVALTTSMSTLQILDQTIQIGDKAFDAIGVSKDAGVRESIKFVAMIVLIAVTVSSGAAASGGVSQLAKLGAATASNIASAVAVTTVSALFSSGLVTVAIVKMLTEIGVKEEDAMLAAMILTIVLMLGMMFAAAKGAGAIAEKAVSSGLKSAEEAGGKAVGDAAGKAASGAAGGGSAGVQQNVADVTQQQINAQAQTKSLLDGFTRAAKECIKDPILLANIVLLIAGGLKVEANIEQAKSEATQADINVAQAEIEKKTAALTALYDYFKALLPGFDATIHKIQEDSKSIQEFMMSFNDTFAQMVASASNTVNKGTTRG